ncbi:MAG: hypothetical protein ACOCZJ_03855, partial [Thermoplasmatota archaeon]
MNKGQIISSYPNYKASYPNYKDQIEFSTVIPEREAEYKESKNLSSKFKKRLEDSDISLYSHQA